MERDNINDLLEYTWITLPSARVKENGLQIVMENRLLKTNVRGHTYDSDQVSGYPSNGMASNVSKDTTSKQVLEIEGVDKDLFKLQNINLMFGKVNSIEYCNTMFNFPKPMEMLQHIKDKEDKIAA